MNESIAGIHHVTAIATDPQKNLDFYAGVLGLRMVKKTVNFDDPGTYHFYFGDGLGKMFFGSRTMSDMVWFREVPAIKCGPGQSERSHTPDEYVLASEIREGHEFYRRLTWELAKLLAPS